MTSVGAGGEGYMRSCMIHIDLGFFVIHEECVRPCVIYYLCISRMERDTFVFIARKMSGVTTHIYYIMEL